MEGRTVPTKPVVPDSHRDLVAAPLVASLATIAADMTPQVTAIWFLAEDDSIRFSLTTDRQKYKNMLVRPHATLFLIDPENPFRTLELRGAVEMVDDIDLAVLRRLFRHYGHDPDAAGIPVDGRVAVTLHPSRIVAQG